MTDGSTNQGASLSRKVSYTWQLLRSYAWQRLTRRAPTGPVHLIFTLADHFEPGIVPEDGSARAPYDVQERRLETWCREYPRLVDRLRDREGRPFCHTYFYPAEQYDRALVQRLASHCHEGWGEIEIHLHHGVRQPDTAANTRRQLLEFRDALAWEHGCLSCSDEAGSPRYAFVHGNFALANSNEGRGCGVDSEMRVLAESGCYADLTMPAAPFHPSQTSKINSLYECSLPLDQRMPHRQGRDLKAGRKPTIYPLIVQGPLLLDFGRKEGPGIENGSITKGNALTLRRLSLWKRAAVRVEGRPDWLFIKLHCHGMDPRQNDAVIGGRFRKFLEELVVGAESRKETLHFVTAREMANIALAACDGRDGNPGEYRDYRFKRFKDLAAVRKPEDESVAAKG